jgi:hypothetical protein
MTKNVERGVRSPRTKTTQIARRKQIPKYFVIAEIKTAPLRSRPHTMRITKSTLKQLIKEELKAILQEGNVRLQKPRPHAELEAVLRTAKRQMDEIYFSLWEESQAGPPQQLQPGEEASEPDPMATAYPSWKGANWKGGCVEPFKTPGGQDALKLSYVFSSDPKAGYGEVCGNVFDIKQKVFKDLMP